MNFGFLIDNRKCIGCHACTVACKSEHDVPVGVNRTWVKYIEKGQFPNTSRHFSVMRCNHCSNAPCVEICPVSALFVRSDGIVDFDNRRCIGCKACMQACPYDALYLDPQTHTAAKCNYCAHRVDLGLEPACVNVCPEHAIVSGDLEDPLSEISRLVATEHVTVRKEDKGAEPKLFYIDADRASLNPSSAPPSDSYMWSSQQGGVGHFARFAEAKTSKSDPDEMSRRLSQSSPLAPLGIPDPRQQPRVPGAERRVYDAPSKGILWGWEVSAYVWTKALAAGSFLVPQLIKWAGGASQPAAEWFGIILALIFLAATGILLVKDLDRPDRFLYVLLRPQWRSWLVRGAYIITAYGLALGAALGMRWFQADSSLADGCAAILAVLTAAYTAFLFAQAKARDFWQSPILGLHMLVQAVVAGAAIFAVSALWLSLPLAWIAWLKILMAASLVMHLAAMVFELWTPHSTRDAAWAAEALLRGSHAGYFWAGAVVMGSAAPLVSMGWGGAGLASAGLLALGGLYIQEHLWVRVPQLLPLS